MKRILLRAAKHPFEPVSAAATIKRNTFANNVGNLLFSNAVFKHLSVEGTALEVNAPHLNGDKADPEVINERYDAFVLPMANAFRPSFMPHLETLTRLIERLDIPVVVVGVGAQTDVQFGLDGMSALDRKVARFAAAVLDRSASIGVRGEFTADYLRRLGFDDVEVIGCPSLFTHGPGFCLTEPKSSLPRDARLALSYTPWASDDDSIAADLLARTLRDFEDVVYYPQDMRDLSLLFWGDTAGLNPEASPSPVDSTHPLLASDRTRFPLEPTAWRGALAQRDFAFGTRLHGNVAAHLAGTPAMILAHDSRTLELARYFDLPHVMLHDLDPGVGPAELYGQLDVTKFNSGYEERFERYRTFLSANGLQNCFDHGDGGRAFEEQMASAEFPEPVRPWSKTVDKETGLRISWLKERVDKLGDRDGQIVKRVKKLESQIAELQRQAELVTEEQQAQAAFVDRRFRSHKKRAEALAARVKGLERAWPQRFSGRFRRLLGRG